LHLDDNDTWHSEIMVLLGADDAWGGAEGGEERCRPPVERMPLAWRGSKTRTNCMRSKLHIGRVVEEVGRFDFAFGGNLLSLLRWKGFGGFIKARWSRKTVSSQNLAVAGWGGSERSYRGVGQETGSRKKQRGEEAVIANI